MNLQVSHFGTSSSVRKFVGTPKAHESAKLHVSGEAVYVDDIPEPTGCLQACYGLSQIASGEIERMDLDEVKNHPGVFAVIAAADIPENNNNIGPVYPDEPLFPERIVSFYGQPLFAVAAKDLKTALKATQKAVITYREVAPNLDPEQSMREESYVAPASAMQRGNPDQAFVQSQCQSMSFTYNLGGQDHFYLEGQVALCIPGENNEFLLYSSTQHPGEVQHMAAKVLGIADHKVVVETRRMGGGFGGKETQAAGVACSAALLARATGKAVKLRLERDTDMLATGKRHPFRAHVQVGYHQDGSLTGLNTKLMAVCGWSADLSQAICSRAMFHTDNAYFIPNLRVEGYCCKTNHVSQTAFRGFGGPQGMFFTEQVLDDLARKLNMDPLDVRKRNYYGEHPNNLTHYGQEICECEIREMTEILEISSSYRQRRKEIRDYNADPANPLKRGLALTPVKFGISFTKKSYNQAGALIQIYADGSIQLNHGGTEMGQGLFIKVAQIVAEVFQVGLETVRCMATNTGKVPNASATAASSGSDLNGMAAKNAAEEIKKRLLGMLAAEWGVSENEIRFADGYVVSGSRRISFSETANLAVANRISLSSTGYYRTPEIHYDPETAQGSPFYYFSYGVSVTEAEVDTRTGEYRFLRTDILHDCGSSLNEAVDRGQIEGGFIQGLGWLTTEELFWEESGRLRTHAPSTYKIPTCRDIPDILNVDFYRKPNAKDTVHRSKAVGEPPFMLAFSAFFALKDAVASLAPPGETVLLNAPATNERVLLEAERLKSIR